MSVVDELGYALSQFDKDVKNLGAQFNGVKEYFKQLKAAIKANMNGEVIKTDCKSKSESSSSDSSESNEDSEDSKSEEDSENSEDAEMGMTGENTAAQKESKFELWYTSGPSFSGPNAFNEDQYLDSTFVGAAK